MSSIGENKNGWNEYSIQYLKKEIAEMRVREDRVNDLKDWKNAIDEIASPTQLKQILDDFEDIKQFKTKAVTIFMVVQFAMGVALAMAKIY